MVNEMRDRLVEILGDEGCTKPIPCDICEYKDFYDCHNYARADRLIENGVTIIPCNVGNTVYQVGTDRNIYESTIKKIIYDTTSIAFDERAIGESIFLTKSEAEQKLKEMRGE